GLRVFSQSLEIPFVFSPADIGRMRFGQERVPFFAWQLFYSAFAIDTLARSAATEDKHSGIARIVQHAPDMAVLEFAPDHISLCWARMNAAGEKYAAVAEVSNCCQGRSCSLKRIE